MSYFAYENFLDFEIIKKVEKVGFILFDRELVSIHFMKINFKRHSYLMDFYLFNKTLSFNYLNILKFLIS